MSKEQNVKATSYSSRIKVAAEAKNKETTASLFFYRRQRSKVIARVTQKSPIGFLRSFRAYLALAGGSKPSFHLPMVAFTMACTDAKRHPNFHNLRYKCYGK